MFLAFRGRNAEALNEITKIDQLDSGLGAAFSESETYYLLRDYPNLIEAGRRGLLVDPHDWSQHVFVGIGNEGVGRFQDAISEYRKAVEMSGGDPNTMVSLAHAYSAAGKRAEAEKILRDLERKPKGASISSYTTATLYAVLGDKDRAFAQLDKAYSERALDLYQAVKADLRLDGLRSDPRFASLLRKFGAV